VVKGLPLGVCVIASLIFYFASQGQGHSPLARAIRQGLGEFNALSFANRFFQPVFSLLALLMAAMVGAPLIAEDRRAHALPLYFSRPITHFDYVLGKLASLVFFLGLVLLLPPLCLYLADVAFSTGDGIAAQHFPTLLRSLVPGCVGCIALSSVALGVSSLVDRTNQAVLLFFGVLVTAMILGNLFAFQVFRDPAWRALSPLACVERIAIWILPLPPRFEMGSRRLAQLDVGLAWTAISIWTGAGLGLLLLRIRKVEVVT